MSKPVRFVISHVSDKPIDRKAFKRASQAVGGYLRFVAYELHGAVKPGWGADEHLIHFGGNPSDFDRQTPFYIARDPALYRTEGSDYPIEVRAMTPEYASIIQTVVMLINHHTDNALLLSQDPSRSASDVAKRSVVMVGAK